MTVISNEDCIAMLNYNTTREASVRTQVTEQLPYGLNYGLFWSVTAAIRIKTLLSVVVFFNELYLVVPRDTRMRRREFSVVPARETVGAL